MNALIARSTADIIVFTDANTTIDLKAVDAVRRYFDDPTIGCVCGNLQYINQGESATASVGSFYWRFEQVIKRIESETGSTMGADGALFAIRRKLFREVPVDIIDDMFTSMSILCDGYRVVQAYDFIAYERSVTHSGEEFKRKVRIACRAFNCHRLLWGRIKASGPLNLYKYISHKWLRWLAGLWIIAAGVTLLAGLMLAHLLWITLALVVVGIVFYFMVEYSQSRITRAIGEILRSFMATSLGVWKSLRGERFQTWAVAATARAAEPK
jgi:cellulose synthase/poly-beta-1,6-N-acetylglucosamine synthase-like glycosyltransferase